MFQKFLDGKKKYSAFIITILATLVPLFVQEPEAQKTFIDMVPSIAALIAGLLYIITQGGIDKEKAKAANGTGAGAGAVVTMPAQPAQPAAQLAQPPAAQPAAPEPEVAFDAKSFHAEVLATVLPTYAEVNPCTILYKARDKGSVTTCQSMTQALGYWSYLVDLAVEADAWLKVQTEKKAGTCGRSPEYYAFRLDYANILKAQTDLYDLARTNIDWRAKLTPTQNSLYQVGTLAYQLLAYR